MADRVAAFQQKKEDAPAKEPLGRTSSSREVTKAKSALFEKKVCIYYHFCISNFVAG